MNARFGKTVQFSAGRTSFRQEPFTFRGIFVSRGIAGDGNPREVDRYVYTRVSFLEDGNRPLSGSDYITELEWCKEVIGTSAEDRGASGGAGRARTERPGKIRGKRTDESLPPLFMARTSGPYRSVGSLVFMMAARTRRNRLVRRALRENPWGWCLGGGAARTSAAPG